MHTHPRTKVIAEAIISLGHALSLEVVAEGVEDEAQMQTLRTMGCDFVQGYLLGRPLPVEGADKLLAGVGLNAASGRAQPL